MLCSVCDCMNDGGYIASQAVTCVGKYSSGMLYRWQHEHESESIIESRNSTIHIYICVRYIWLNWKTHDDWKMRFKVFNLNVKGARVLSIESAYRMGVQSKSNNLSDSPVLCIFQFFFIVPLIISCSDTWGNWLLHRDSKHSKFLYNELYGCCCL